MIWSHADRTVKSMRGGLQPLAIGLKELVTGVQLAVRTPQGTPKLSSVSSTGLGRLAAWLFVPIK
jgi:hypothetical protein